MSVTGRVNLVDNPTQFFGPLLFGAAKPDGGYVPCRSSGVVVTMLAFLEPFGFSFALFADVSAEDGSFKLPDIPPGLLTLVSQVSIHLSLHGRPFYRSGRFARSHDQEPLDIFVYQPQIPSTDGVAAGLISKGLANVGLPGDTKLTANPWGLAVVGDKSGADVKFGIQLLPDTTPNLAVFFDMALDGWNIHVGWPADACKSADGILNSIRTALQTSGSVANGLVTGTITTAFESAPLNLNPQETAKLLSLVSIQFVVMALPTQHTWALSNTKDETIVIVPQLTLGFPRFF